MGIIIKQSIQNTIISYLGIVLGFVATILFFPRFLTADQYGLTRVLISLALVSTQFSNLGIKNITLRFFPYFDQRKNSRYELLTLSLVVPFVGFLLFCALFFLFDEQLITAFKDRSALFSEYYLYLLPLAASILFFEALNSYIRALKDSIPGSVINEVVVRVLIIVLLISYAYGLLSFTGFMVLFVLIYGIQPLYLLAYLFQKNELHFSVPFKKKNKPFLRLISVYGVYSLLGGISTMLVANIDILMLGSMTNLANTAIYFIAFSVGSVIAVPQRSINKIATPILSGLLKDKKYAEVESLYRRTSLNQIVAGSLLFIGIWANLHNLMGLLPAEYQGSEWVIIIIGLAKLFDMALGNNGRIILTSKYYRFDLYTNLFLILLTVVTNYLLIPPFGIEGAAIATAISIFIYNMIKFAYVWNKFSMQPFQFQSFAILGLAALCLWGALQIPYLWNFYADVLLRSGAITVTFLGMILVFNLSDDVKALKTESIKRIKRLIS